MSIDWLQAVWPVPSGVRVISTFRSGGASTERFTSLNLSEQVGDEPATVAQNRGRLVRAAAVPSEPCWLAQVHGVAVKNLDLDVATPGAADAAFTRQSGRVCAILTADCLPVLFASEAGDLVGAAHAGWRGLAAGVIEATVAAMNVAAEGLLAWLGPAIGPRHFEVGGEVRQAFLDGDAGSAEAFTQNARGRFMADLAWLARRRLQTLGIRRIYGGVECTYSAADRYFSHRRDGSTGRQATLIWRQ